MDPTGPRRWQPTDLSEPSREPPVRLLTGIWGLLALNTLGSLGAQTLLPLPRPVWQLFTMGAVAVAFLLALLINPRLQIRPSAFLLLLTLLLILSIGSSLRLESGVGALIRCARLALFVATLWLLTCWWDNGMTFVRYHIRVLGLVLLTVAAGLATGPGALDPEGRLVGIVWPLTAPQVAQYSAVVTGLTIILWLTRLTDGRSVAIFVPPSLVLLFLSHTRTATVGLLVGLAVATLSLMLSSARARRAFTRTLLAAGLVAITFGPAIAVWFRRGQDQESLSNLTGRQKVWDALLAAPRSTGEQLFGVGLTNRSFGGLAIDNSWLAVYQDQGLVGCAIVAAFLVTLIVAVVLRPPSPAKACAMFLVVYCLVASYTEAGLGDASPYLLNLVVAAALLAGPGRAEPPPGSQ